MSFRLPLISAVILTTAFAPAPFPHTGRDARHSVLGAMQGCWSQVAERENGKPCPTFGLRAQINNRNLQFYIGQSKADGWQITINPGTTPPGLDMLRLGSRTDKLLARVKVDGDTMIICFSAAQRPQDVSGDIGRAITFKRERK